MAEKIEPGILTLIDLDRTTLDTVRYNEELHAFVGSQDEELARRVKEEQQRVEDLDGTFDPYAHLVDELGSEKADELYEAFIVHVQQNEIKDLLNPGFEDFFAWMTWRQEAFGIFTYGSKESQMTKLRSTGLDKYRHLITQRTEKGLEVASWQREDGTFRVPAALALGDVAVFSSFRTLDDKRDAYVGAPEGSITEYIYRKPGAVVLPSQERAGHDDAVVVTHPDELADKIQSQRPIQSN